MRLIRAGSLRRHPVLVHWSVPVSAAVFLVLMYRKPIAGAAAAIAWISMLLIHELGHAVVAARRGCQPGFIEIYAFHGHYQYTPIRPEDPYFVAWGGVLAQLTLAIVSFIYLRFLGWMPLGFLNAIIVVFVIFNPLVALTNLIPVSPLDGVLPWRLFPMLWRRRNQPKALHDLSPMGAFKKALGNPNDKK